VEPPVQLLDRRLTLLRRVICGATSAAIGQETHTAQAGDLWNYQCSYQTGVILVRRCFVEPPVTSADIRKETHTLQAVFCGATSAAIRQDTHTAQAGDLWSHQCSY
jgi:hypothetical protein